MSGLSRSDIDEILGLLEKSDFDELRLEIGDTKIEIRRNGARPRSDPASEQVASTTAATRSPSRQTPSSPPPSSPSPPPPAPPAAAASGVPVPAPQLGIFYHAPRPGEPPFVSVGDVVEPDTVIGIIEVMKLMNTVAAGVSGTVTEIVAPDGESVRTGDTLIRVEPS